MSDLAPTSPEFLQDRLATLLASPYIHFNKPPASLHIRMGPGPVDVFSSRFANWFTHDCTGVVNGKHVDKEGLKDALLRLQKKWNPESANFVAQDSSSKPTTKFAWTVKNAQQPAEVTASADIKEEGGTHRISSLVLDGDESLFSS
ncbi:hypothetical protein L226DRAFT_471870 [Lentinus tigrinus ALCF2SS1-7]|uniref:Uncharacterized protein n=1 Tax=Lentinus tigrinus ALCF2SS1-6 TaxID=1328759 RepID=A0A5C2RV45_9APHY|nr:hypothetical protein L227DRAFT_616112 [Lentinus tigrinus ALCF2SS1-6]RPD69326.1 hypothetical protein L226DRAFT_471870 [Lentinus tigrinus ALCF2SS1-7]